VAQYRVQIKQSAAKELARVAPELGRNVLQSIERLSSIPRPKQSRKLARSKSSYRLRVGDYRVLYQVDDKAKVVLVFAVRHRREAYRPFKVQ
jgi:mRNA interferase RelE/StbE